MKNNKQQKIQNHKDTSWEKSSSWYSDLIADGSYYHERIILPNVLRLLKDAKSVLDIGCGQGVLAGKLPKDVVYEGVDASATLIKVAQAHTFNKNQHFTTADATKPLPITKKDFDYAVAILSLQNMEQVDKTIANVGAHLKPGGTFIAVLNHPYFRIPKASGWGTNESKEQYRWVTKYMSPMKVAMEMHPGQKHSEQTWSFHHSLADYTWYLSQAGLIIEKVEEWLTDKKSTNPKENESFREIPIFMCLVCKKI